MKETLLPFAHMTLGALIEEQKLKATDGTEFINLPPEQLVALGKCFLGDEVPSNEKLAAILEDQGIRLVDFWEGLVIDLELYVRELKKK